MSGSGPGPRLPAEGATCSSHPERPAMVICPRCGADACIICWQPAVGLCQDCLLREPEAAGPPVPWEDPGRGPGSRFVGTFGTAAHPIASAPAFARPGVGRAALFALLTAVPLAALRGVIPFTHTLRFGPLFHVEVTGAPSGGDIAMDVLRAMGISLLQCAAYLAALTVPLWSLARAYGKGSHPNAALRMMLYRAWLVPLTFQGLIVGLAAWGLPESASTVLLFAYAFEMLPLIILFVSMRSTARMAHGVGPFASILVVLVPLVLMLLTMEILATALGPWLPTPPPSG